MMVLSQAIIADIMPARQRGKYMGLIGSVFGLSSVLGPLLGGFFTDGPGWRWALWFNVPLALVAIVIAVDRHAPACPWLADMRSWTSGAPSSWPASPPASSSSSAGVARTTSGASATIIGLIIASVVVRGHCSSSPSCAPRTHRSSR
jgi:MFS family permease